MALPRCSHRPLLALRRRHLLSLCAGMVGMACCGLASAQARTAYVGASLGYTHDSNITRQPSGQERADSYLSTGAFAAVDLPISRQRLYFNGTVRKNTFNEQSQLDNVSYALSTGLDWATLERLSGSLSYAANRNLASYGGANNPLINTLNVESTRQFDAVARLGGTTALTTEASYQARSLDYSAEAFNFREFDQSAVKLAAIFRSSSKLSVGAGLRVTKGNYPRYRQRVDGSFVADRFRRRDVDLSVNWVPSGLSTVSARLSVGRQTNTELTQYEFSGVTGAVSWTYRPTAKTQFVTTVSRDTGAENRFLDGGGAGQFSLSDTSRLSTAVRLSARYEATAKIQLNGTLAYTRLSLTDALTGGSGTDHSVRLGLGARYAPTRSLAVECNVSRDNYSTDRATNSYDADSVGCTAQAQLTLR